MLACAPQVREGGREDILAVNEKVLQKPVKGNMQWQLQNPASVCQFEVDGTFDGMSGLLQSI